MAHGELLNGPWRKWPDAKAGPWMVGLTLLEVDGRWEVVGMNLWHGALPAKEIEEAPGWASLEPPTTWRTDRGMPGPRAIQATALRDLRFGELRDFELAAQRKIASEHLEDRDATVDLYGEEGAAWALRVAEALVPPPKATGRPRKHDVAHFGEVAAVYTKAWKSGEWPTKAVRTHFNVSAALAAKWVKECRRLELLPKTKPGQALGAQPSAPPRPPGPARRRHRTAVERADDRDAAAVAETIDPITASVLKKMAANDRPKKSRQTSAAQRPAARTTKKGRQDGNR